MLADISENQCDRLSAGQIHSRGFIKQKRFENKLLTFCALGHHLNQVFNVNRLINLKQLLDVSVFQAASTHTDGLIHQGASRQNVTPYPQSPLPHRPHL